MAVAGALACQRDSYLRELTTTVTSCTAGQIQVTSNGKKQRVAGFEVTLKDTILFPEGGGQPDDRGTINDIDVLSVTRRRGDAIHFVSSALEPGSEVKIKVDWTRRWDHMQQHSGQHLITAIAESRFKYPTTSWNLGEKTSFIELDTPSMSNDQMQELEALVNEKILEGCMMYATLYDGAKDKRLPNEVRTRGLPEDHVGPIRVVTIAGVETNMCCGTHVSNLNHLQIIKLLGVEKGKKGKINLTFVAGKRVFQYLSRCYENEKALTGLLKGGPELHVELLSKLQNSYKVAQKSSTTLLREVAILEATKYKLQPDRPPYIFMHRFDCQVEPVLEIISMKRPSVFSENLSRKEGDNEFMNQVSNEINDPSVTVFISCGDEKGAGLVLLTGPEAVVKQVQPKASELLEAKGAVKNGRFQGKANKLGKRHLVEALIKDIVGETAVPSAAATQVPSSVTPAKPSQRAPVTGTLYTYPENFRAFKILIAAQYSGATVKLAKNFKFGETNKSADFLAKFPVGKVPVFESDSGVRLSESNAIAEYVSNETLCGCGHEEQAHIQQWIQFADSEILPACCTWVFPCMGIMQCSVQSVDRAKRDLQKALNVLNQHLASRPYLATDHITLADICVASNLILPYQWVLEPSLRQPYPHLNKWFTSLIQQPQFKSVIGDIKLCQKTAQFDAKKFRELRKKEEASKSAGGMADEAHITRKDPLASLAAGTFDMDGWKKIYTTSDWQSVAMPQFWKNFDSANYSLWYCVYNQPEELKLPFISCNLITGMFDRLEPMKKYAFASMILFGDETNSSIAGVWAWRGQDLIFKAALDLQVDYDSFTWKKLDPNSKEDRTLVTEHFTWQGKFSGKRFNQGFIFK